jgi:hypothetical protein
MRELKLNWKQLSQMFLWIENFIQESGMLPISQVKSIQTFEVLKRLDLHKI